MAVDVTLARGGDSVAIPLLESDGGNPLLATDVGKPELDLHSSGALNPRVSDFWSGLEQYTILGKFVGASAYSDARDLADLVKDYSGGTDLTLDVPLDEFDDDIVVAPAAGQDEAVSLRYPPGHKNVVEVDLGLTRVSKTRGSGTDDASTPTSGGSGPIQLTRGSTSVELSDGIEVTRAVGRPQSTVRRARGDFPNYFDKRKAAHESFQLSLQFTGGVTSTVQSLVNDVFRPKLKRGAITLDFQGVFGYGSFSVVPAGSNAVRHVRPSGYKDVSLVPTVNLRRVLAD